MASLISPDMKVEEALTRFPGTLETFVQYGFKPLKHPLLRKALAPIITIRAAANMHHWEPERLDQFLRDLNDRALLGMQAPLIAPAVAEAPLYDITDVAGLRAQNILVSPTVIQIDNRRLEPPEPMLRILATAQQLAPGQRIEAINERQPVLLYAKLAELGFQHQVQALPDGCYLITVSRG